MSIIWSNINNNFIRKLNVNIVIMGFYRVKGKCLTVIKISVRKRLNIVSIVNLMFQRWSMRNILVCVKRGRESVRIVGNVLRIRNFIYMFCHARNNKVRVNKNAINNK